MGFELFALVFLLLLSAFFSGSETAIFSLNDIRVKRLTKEGSKFVGHLNQILKFPKRLLISILAGNLFVNMLSSSISERILSNWFGVWSLEISIVLMTLAILIVGEIVPKVIAIEKAESWSLRASYPLRFLITILFPLSNLIKQMTDWVAQKIFSSTDHHMTSDELHTAVSESHQSGVLDPRESKMIHGIMGLSKRSVKELMRPRDEIFACAITVPMQSVYEKIRKRKYSRVPMYRENLDQIVGILYGKDLMMEGITQNRVIQIYDLLRKPYFVPELMKANQLFREFRKKRIHMAIVMDEFGGVAGLITLEDLIEEIVGEVVDKQDIDPLYKKIQNNIIQVKSRMLIKDFNELMGVSLEDISAVTIGGFLINKMGRIPQLGNRYIFGDLEFEVLSAQKNHLEELLVTRIKPMENS